MKTQARYVQPGSCITHVNDDQLFDTPMKIIEAYHPFSNLNRVAFTLENGQVLAVATTTPITLDNSKLYKN